MEMNWKISMQNPRSNRVPTDVAQILCWKLAIQSQWHLKSRTISTTTTLQKTRVFQINFKNTEKNSKRINIFWPFLFLLPSTVPDLILLKLWLKDVGETIKTQTPMMVNNKHNMISLYNDEYGVHRDLHAKTTITQPNVIRVSLGFTLQPRINLSTINL